MADTRALAVPFYTLGDLQQDLGDLMEALKKGFGGPSFFITELRDIASALEMGDTVMDMEVGGD